MWVGVRSRLSLCERAIMHTCVRAYTSVLACVVRARAAVHARLCMFFLFSCIRHPRVYACRCVICARLYASARAFDSDMTIEPSAWSKGCECAALRKPRASTQWRSCMRAQVNISLFLYLMCEIFDRCLMKCAVLCIFCPDLASLASQGPQHRRGAASRRGCTPL